MGGDFMGRGGFFRQLAVSYRQFVDVILSR